MSDNSPAPGTPQTSTKAAVAAVLGFVGAFVVSLAAATVGRTDLDTLTKSQWLVLVLGALATAVVSFGGTYRARNKAKGLSHVGGGQ